MKSTMTEDIRSSDYSAQKSSQKDAPENLAVHAVLLMFYAADCARRRLENACVQNGVTHSQYHILRILNAAYPDGYSRCEIIAHLFDRAPDATRLIDRLERQGLVERARSEEDRRLSIARITPKGRATFERITPCYNKIWEDITDELAPAEADVLLRICEKIAPEAAEKPARGIRIEM